MSITIEAFTQRFNETCEKGELLCPICIEPYQDPYIITKCLHIFCRSCLHDWMKVDSNKNTCPECRMLFNAKDLKHDFHHHRRVVNIWNELAEREGINSDHKNPYANSHMEHPPWKKKSRRKISTRKRSDHLPSEDQPGDSSLIQGVFRTSMVPSVDSRPYLQATTYQNASLRRRRSRPLRKIREIVGVYRTANRTLHSIASIEGVYITNCIVENDIFSQRGAIFANGCKVKTAKTVGREIVFRDTIFSSVYAQMNRVECRYSVCPDEFQNARITAKKDILLEKARFSGVIRSEEGAITATDCNLSGVLSCVGKATLFQSTVSTLEINSRDSSTPIRVILSGSKIESELVIREGSSLYPIRVEVTGSGEIIGAIRCHRAACEISLANTITHHGRIIR